MSSKRLLRNRTEQANRMMMTSIAPMNAADMVNKKPDKLNQAVVSALPQQRRAMAAPKLAPALTPKTEGSAKGLANTVCMMIPLTASALPANIAVKIEGSLDSNTIILAVSVASGENVMTFQISSMGRWILPQKRLRGIIKHKSRKDSRCLGIKCACWRWTYR